MKEKLQRFMMGRYGMDNLNNTLIGASLFFVVLQVFTKAFIFSFLSWVCWGFCIYRMFSRKVYQRNSENVLFLEKTKKIRHQADCIKRNFQDKNNRYYTCPACGQMVRVPRGRGKIEISCPKCRHRFERKS